MTWASLALAALVAQAEAAGVVQESTPTGQFSAVAVYGPGQVFSRTAGTTLDAWNQASHQFGGLWSWLAVQAGFGALLIAGYVGLGLSLRAATPDGLRPPGPLRRLVARWRLARWWPLYALALANLAQDVIVAAVAWGWIRPHRPVPAQLAGSLEAAIIAKWVLAVVLAGWLGYRMLASPASPVRARLIGGALKKQRFSVVIVAALGVIAVGRGNGVLDQVPDVQRAWLTWPPSLGWAHLAFAVLAQGLLAVLLVLLSAMRVQRTQAARLPGEHRDVHSYLPWLLTALAVPALALALWRAGWAAVAWGRVIAVPVVLGAVAGASLATQLARRKTAAPAAQAVPAAPAAEAAPAAPAAEAAPAASPAEAAPPDGAGGAAGHSRDVAAARTAGDMLAVAVIAVTGLGLVRSFTAAALVAGPPYRWASWAAVAAGFAVAAGAWVAARGRLQDLAAYFGRKYHSTGWRRSRTGISPRRTGGNDEQRSPARLLAAFAAPLLAADLLLIFLPLWATHWLGVLATTVIALGTLAVGLAVLAYLVQSRQPLPVFRLLRLKATPVFTLILIVGLAGGALDPNPALHDIRLPAAVAGSAGTVAAPAHGAPTMLDSLRQWLADPATRSCAIPAPAPASPPGQAGQPGPAAAVRVEPLVLAAAAGGGIRAAWWTVHALGRLAGTPCRRHALFAASGSSGGSIGLAIMGTTARPGPALSRIAGPDALAAAIDGLLLRDTAAGLAGLDFTAAGMPAGQRYPDRAALMEHAWERQDPRLAQPFPLRHPALPWRLMFGSTAAGTGCLAVIADRQVAPPVTGPAATSASCGLPAGASLPDSYDFFAELPCLSGLSTSTAALLSARFPYVTPSGVADGCGPMAGHQVEQYVDGGYADSTGLATLAGLVPQFMPVIRQYNADAVTGRRPGQPVTLVLPVIADLVNSPQQEPPAGTAASSPSQPLIPVYSGAASAHGQLSDADALLQQLAAATGEGQRAACGPGGGPCAPAGQWLSCPARDSRCTADRQAAARSVPQQLIVVAPREYPAVTAPLGWVLSPASRRALDQGLSAEAAATCPHPGRAERYCPAGVGRLGDLLRLTRG